MDPVPDRHHRSGRDTPAARASVTSRCSGIDQTNVYVTDQRVLHPRTGVQRRPDLRHRQVRPGRRRREAHFVHFDNLTIGGRDVAPQPALTSREADRRVLPELARPNGTGDNRVGVWAMTNRGAASARAARRRCPASVITSEAYAIPPGASQKGAKSTLDSGDDRMQQTQFIGGTIWGELGTAVHPAGDSTVRAGARLVRGAADARRGQDHRCVDRPPGLCAPSARPVRALPGGAGGRGRERGDGLHARPASASRAPPTRC